MIFGISLFYRIHFILGLTANLLRFLSPFEMTKKKRYDFKQKVSYSILNNSTNISAKHYRYKTNGNKPIRNSSQNKNQ